LSLRNTVRISAASVQASAVCVDTFRSITGLISHIDRYSVKVYCIYISTRLLSAAQNGAFRTVRLSRDKESHPDRQTDHAGRNARVPQGRTDQHRPGGTLFAVLLAGATLLAGCGGGGASRGGGGGGSPQSYTGTVTATSGVIQQTSAVSLTVQ
jgi:hypothetical protein